MADKNKQKEIAKYLNDPKRAVILSKKGIEPKKLKKLADKYSEKPSMAVSIIDTSGKSIYHDLLDKHENAWEDFRNLREWRGKPQNFREWLRQNEKRDYDDLLESEKPTKDPIKKEEKKDKKKKDDDDDDEPPRKRKRWTLQDIARLRKPKYKRGEKRGDQDEFDLFEALSLAAGVEGARRLWKKLPKKKIASFLARSAARHRAAGAATIAGPVVGVGAQLVATGADAAEMMPSKEAEAAARKKAAVKQQRRLDKKAKRWKKQGAVGLPESPSGSRTTAEDEGDE